MELLCSLENCGLCNHFMSAGRKSTDSNAPQPALKVVGFRVEGVPPSPEHGTLLQDALTSGGGSPDPVIIPPSFQASQSLHHELLAEMLPL